MELEDIDCKPYVVWEFPVNEMSERASKDSFQAGQTAKARRGLSCAVTPCERTCPPAYLRRSIEKLDVVRNPGKHVM
jgi:hypothetical protein